MSRILHQAFLVAVALATCGTDLPALAQQDQSRGQQPQQDQRGERQRDQQSEQMQRQRQQQRNPRDLALQPLGWVRVAVDYDQDNRFDAMETIYYYDLVEARQRSAHRRVQQGRGRQPMARSRQQMQRISGRVSNMRTFRLIDGQQHQLAKIETEQGRTAVVDLGRVEEIEPLNLQRGDRITVVGTRARINDRSVLCARRVEAGGQQVAVHRERDRGLKRVRGRITDLRTATFRGRDQQFQVAEMDLRGGRTETVILGPRDQLQPLGLQQGDSVRLLVRPGRLNDQPALIAEQVRAHQQTVSVREPQGRRLSSRQQ